MPDKVLLTYVTQSSSPLAAFVDFSAASAWPILLSPSRAIRSQLHARRFPLPQNTSVHSAPASQAGRAILPRSVARCHALEIRAALPLPMCSDDQVIVSSAAKHISCAVAADRLASICPSAFVGQRIPRRPRMRQIN